MRAPQKGWHKARTDGACPLYMHAEREEMIIDFPLMEDEEEMDGPAKVDCKGS